MSKLATELMEIADDYRAVAHNQPAVAWKLAAEKMDEKLRPVREALESAINALSLNQETCQEEINASVNECVEALALLVERDEG